ncbi:neprilysin-1 [Stomoxys calcitrans]|uniref:neprilysin-1 n=1 Tax=Stomoxys calcitrans TaxID=35570 RepID=UPI0027E2AF02|nr:neprilysin-1 [Stomoxys calcitrans]
MVCPLRISMKNLAIIWRWTWFVQCSLILTVTLGSLIHVHNADFAAGIEQKDNLLEVKAQQMKSYLNESVEPCDNFYEYVCGNYNSFSGNYSSLAMPNLRELSTIYNTLLIEELKTEDAKHDNDVDRMVKTFYKSCVNLNATYSQCNRTRSEILEKYGKFPMQLEEGEWPEDQYEWSQHVAEIFYNTGVRLILGVGPMHDFTNNSRTIVGIYEPEFADSYIGVYDQEAYAAYRDEWEHGISLYLQSLLHLKDGSKVLAEVKDMMSFEIALGKGKVNKTLGMQNSDIFNLTSVKELQRKYSPQFDVRKFLKVALDYVPQQVYVNHKYLEHALETLRNTPKRVVANYVLFSYFSTLEMHLVSKQEDFESICLPKTHDKLYKQLDNLFYRKFITQDMIKDMEFLWHQLRAAFKEDFLSDRLSWLEDDTRLAALEKLQAMKFEILSHESDTLTQDYQYLKLSPNNFMENILALQAWTANLTRAYIHRTHLPDDDDGNAVSYVPSYSPKENVVKVPVSVLYQHHKYAPAYPKAVNFGTLGSFIGHEMVHGFDDAGRKFDALGNIRNWWRPKCLEEFENRTKCFMQQYHNFTLDDGVHHLPAIKLQAENIADNGGVRAAFTAYMKWYEQELSSNAQLVESEQLPGLNFTHAQLFFVSYGQIWCTDYVPPYEFLTQSLHAPAKFRVLGSLSNFEEFAKAFQCPVGSAMNPVDKCQIY